MSYFTVLWGNPDGLGTVCVQYVFHYVHYCAVIKTLLSKKHLNFD